MPLFGRRRSLSLADEGSSTQQLPYHPALGSHEAKEGILHGLFRRHSEDSLSPGAPQRQKKQVRSLTQSPPISVTGILTGIQNHETPSHSDLDRSQRRRGRDESCQSSGDSTPSTPNDASAAAQTEPKQPGNIQDYLEHRIEMASKPRENLDSNVPVDDRILSKKEIMAILSGAPHFLLERGKHKRWYPQVIFPWDDHNPSIQRMLDRKPLSHPAFVLCTLHAHLPVPDDWAVRGGVPTPIECWGRSDASKRATFDVGIFEVPNMLGNNGREPGTVGFRHFLELPMSDARRYTGPEEPRQAPNIASLNSLPATEAFDLMEKYNRPYSQCLSGAIYDRRQLIRDGPNAWKRIGVRDINLPSLAKRINRLRQIRRDVLLDGSTNTILDFETSHEQYNLLHSQFLYPRPPLAEVMPGHPQSIKSQIKTLATVLATPGAWVDFSLPEWRFRAGQLLWEVPRQGTTSKTSKESWINDGMERKWLLVQLLLATELLLRLDAFVRVDMLRDPHGGQMTVQEVYNFDKLREGKVNWDLVVVRRFLDNLEIECPSTSPAAAAEPNTPTKTARFSFFESIGRHISSVTEKADLCSPWQCHISSPHTRQQLEGLYNFAENIGWPKMDAIRSTFEVKLQKNRSIFFTQPNKIPRDKEHAPSQPSAALLVDAKEMYSRSPSRRCVRLHSECSDDGDLQDGEPFGWISRSWLSGFVIPGEAICHLLIGTLLENDEEAMQQLGPMANLYGGFAYAGRSWWSKSCIVGRVLSSLQSTKTCMGWVGSDILPRDATTLEVLGNGWFEVAVENPLERSGKPRIKQGGKLAAESTPLGMGDITADAFTLPIDLPPPATTTVSLGALTLSVSTLINRGITASEETSLSFSLQGEGNSSTAVSFPLKHNVRFISAHACRPPLGFTSHHHPHHDQPLEDDAAADNGQEKPSTWGQYTRLPGHPLHRSFPYQHVQLDALPNHRGPQATTGSSADKEVLVIDARGPGTKETFVRAWCASIGSHALIGRAGRTCVACCVREARAVDVQVVVRVGE
ncbi:hypothetical protein N7509_002995 [Penicillium cosmopolitanum]|uniref:Uncharacterized protein n=1 Tax=Penicillium cosmopolitanum TaxID=1131564 RepID=A0A9W9W9U7_9EURO|nr:uncharacterized protein N7509_002995 [Penicillium cosmopolitanum]KAJ5409112.1 hypothetical protein N7509_002995 [Penicillium cosmopolitanum]